MTSTACWIKTRHHVPEHRSRRGLLDTSVVIAMPGVRRSNLPDELAVSAVTLAELATGPHATDDVQERALRQDRLQRVETTIDAIPFDADSARAYGRIYAAVAAKGRKARGRRALDLLIAASALSAELPLYTCNPSDFEGLDHLIDIVPVDST
jgi:predicted nucleic acid-binding protein